MKFLRQNTAVRITVGPFIDKADGLTPLNAITTVANIVGNINYDDDDGTATHPVHFHPSASGGDNDMVTSGGADGAGLWDLELTAAQTNYTGRMILSLTDAAQICPVFHEFQVLAANVYDSLFTGAGQTADLLDVNVAQWLGTGCHTATTGGIPVVQLHDPGAGSGGLNAPVNFDDLAITDTTGLVDITQTAADKAWTTAVRVLTANTNLANLEVDVTKIHGSALSETSGGYLAAAFVKLFDVATPVFTAASVNQTGDTYAQLPPNFDDLAITDTTGLVSDTSGTTELLTRIVNTKIASTTGNWATAGTWADAAVPSAGDNIIIRDGVTVTVAASLDLGAFGTLEVQGDGVLNIASSQTVATLPAGWIVNSNSGTITINNGIVHDNASIVSTNFGTIQINSDTVTANSGTIVFNDGTVGTNAASGIVSQNLVGATVTINEANGVVQTNLGTIGTNQSGGVITDNLGTITTNASGGIVANNLATVTTNNGTVYSTQISADAALDAYNTTGVAKEATVGAIATILTGITSLAQWLRGLYRKDAMNATAKTEINSGGGTFSELTDSLEAQTDSEAADAAVISATVWANATRTLTGTALAVGPSAGRNQTDIRYTVFKGGTIGLYARVLAWDGDDLTQADVTSLAYTIYSLDEHDARTAVAGHTAVALDKTAVIWDAVQSDEWASDWNFKLIPDISPNVAFAAAGTNALVEVTITPATGEVILVRFRVKIT
jgi:hypothetical protein